MKTLFRIAFALSSLIATVANADDTPKRVDVSYRRVYIPEGFDTNDRVQIVGAGLFPNTCYKPANVKFRVDHRRMRITVAPMALEYPGICLMVLVPFHQVIDVGLLRAGKYIIAESTSDRELGMVEVKAATVLDADDYLYAPISQAYVQSKSDGSHHLILQGSFSNTCLKFVDVVVNIKDQVIVAQPISELDASGSDPCVDKQVRFEKSIQLDTLVKGRYLLHVRSINGQAINALIDIL